MKARLELKVFNLLVIFICTPKRLRKEFEIASQLLKSGTSIGANVREAQRGVSTKDFKNKFGIALKEAEETCYWLEIIEAVIEPVPNDLKNKCDELIRILVAIIKNS